MSADVSVDADLSDNSPSSSVSASSSKKTARRARHDEKITIYLTSDQLVELEQLRLALRTDHQIVADRGRIVREAISIAVKDFAENQAKSQLVVRLASE